MKKILSILVAMLLVISIPVSAAPKKIEKPKPVKTNKQIKISIAASSTALEVGKEITLTATNNKQGLTVYEQDIQAQTWVVQFEGKTIASTDTHEKNYNITKKAAKNSPTSVLKFKPTQEGKYTFIYSIRMGAGKSKVSFYGTSSLTMETTKSAEQTETSNYKFTVGDIPSFIEPLHKVGIPVTLEAPHEDCKDYHNARVNVEHYGPGELNLWIDDSSDHVYDAAELGYCKPADGFQIDKDDNIDLDFDAVFSKKGTYFIKLSLVDLNNHDDHTNIITSQVIKVVVGESTGDIESTYIFQQGKIQENIKAMEDITLPITLMSNEVNAIGYDHVKTTVDCTAPENGEVNLWAKVKDADGNQYTGDAAKLGYWGPETGFSISKTYKNTTYFTARFSVSGPYKITFNLVDLDKKNIIASRTISINVGTTSGGIENLTVNRLSVVPSTNSKNLYTLTVTDLLVKYESGSTLVKINHVIGDVSFDDLVKSGYSKTFKITYNNYEKSFTLTGKQILNLL